MDLRAEESGYDRKTADTVSRVSGITAPKTRDFAMESRKPSNCSVVVKTNGCGAGVAKQKMDANGVATIVDRKGDDTTNAAFAVMGMETLDGVWNRFRRGLKRDSGDKEVAVKSKTPHFVLSSLVAGGRNHLRHQQSVI